MLKNKLLLMSLLIGAAIMPVNAEVLTDVQYPKPPAYRVGISELPETQYVQALQEKIKPEKKYAQIDNSQDSNIADLTYADLSIKRLSKEIAQELEFEEQDMLADLTLLWQGAAMQSDTINFALYKLANPDADKPDPKSLKKVLTTIASMSTLVGASMGSPILAGSSLIGGNILGIMSQDTKALNYKYTRVTDADMIILIRKIEDLQQNAVNLYYDYISSKKQLELSTSLAEERQRKFNLAQKNNAPRELIVITDAYYRTALDKQRAAKAEFFAKRAALEQFVGNETFVQFEADLTARENGENIKNASEKEKTAIDAETTAVSEPAYEDTVKNVEIYKNSLNNPSDFEEDINIAGLDEEADKNLVNVPPLRSIEEDSGIDDVTTGSSSNIDNEKASKKTGFLKKFKKENKDEKITEEDVKIDKKSKTVEKNTTKGLIFLHNTDKETAKKQYRSNPVQKVNSEKSNNSADVETNINSNSYNFAPLDEIRVPELNSGGYSIHSDSFEEINNADPLIQY